MAGSILKNFKKNLQDNDLLRPHSKKKTRKNVQAIKDRREVDRKVLSSIRDAFNPFDMKVTKTKHNDLGRAIIGQVGRPGISKQAGEQERRQTYEAQRRLQNKVGLLVDRRFGEKDKSMTEDEKMVQRFARAKIAAARKSSKFSLDDDENLTHYGQALSFDTNTELGQDDYLQGETVDGDQRSEFGEGYEEDHLGEEETGQVRKKSKHEVMREVIAKSKAHKAARQLSKAHDMDIVDQLNEAETFRSLMADLDQFDRSNKPSQIGETNVEEDYDANVNSMVYDRRAAPQSRVKTEEELAKEAEQKHKEQLKERERRMEGDDLDHEGEGDAVDDAALFGLHGLDESGAEEGHSYSDLDSDEREALEDFEKSESEVRSKVEIPQNTNDLEKLLGDSTNLAPLKTLLKKLDPSLAAGNKEKVKKVLVLACRLLVKQRADSKERFNQLLELIRYNMEDYREAVSWHFKGAIKRVHEKIAKNQALSSSDLLLFPVISVLYPTSDQWHPLVNPASLAMAQHLSSSMSMSPKDIAQCLFLCDTLLSYQRISHRVIPEVGAYILRVLSSIPCTPSASHLVRVNAKQQIDLSSRFGSELAEKPISVTSLESVTMDQLIVHLAKSIQKAASLWKSSDAFVEIFSPMVAALAALPENPVVSAVTSSLQKQIKWAIRERKPLRLQELRPMAIVTQAPMFEDNFNPELKNIDMDPERRELSKLRAQYKKERKQTLKEIRRDSEFVARQRIDEKREESRNYHQMLSKLTNQINSEEGAERNLYERERKAKTRRR